MGAFTINGNYAGAGGTMAINTVLGGDGSPSDRLVISGGTATGNTIVHVTNVGGAGAETTGNGIQVVSAVSGATTLAGRVRPSRMANCAPAPSTMICSAAASAAASPNDWFLRSDFVGRRWRRRWRCRRSCLCRSRHSPLIRRPNPLPPGVVFPIIGPELATYGVVQPLARQLGLSILGTLDDRVGDTYEPDGCAVAPAVRAPRLLRSTCRPRSRRRCRPRSPGLRPARCSRPRSGGASSAKRSTTTIKPSPIRSANGDLGGFQGGIDLLRGSLIAGHYDRAGLYGAYGDVHADVNGLVTNPAATAYVLTRTGSMNLNCLVGGRLLDACRARRLVSRRRAARDLVLRLGQHPVREA